MINGEYAESDLYHACLECMSGRIKCVSNSNSFQGICVGDEFDVVDGIIENIPHEFAFNNIDEINWYFDKYGIQFELLEQININ